MTEVEKCVRRPVDGRQTHTRACTLGDADCDLSRNPVRKVEPAAVTIDAAEVLALIDQRIGEYRRGYDRALEMLRDDVQSLTDKVNERRMVDALSAPLHYDIERAALNAYSEIQTVRNGRGVFRDADHRSALMAAIDAVDKLRAGSNDKE
jgi:hypothetical protein